MGCCVLASGRGRRDRKMETKEPPQREEQTQLHGTRAKETKEQTQLQGASTCKRKEEHSQQQAKAHESASDYPRLSRRTGARRSTSTL